MATPDEALQSQIRNIEAAFGKTIGDWGELIKKSGLTKHTEVVAMLKQEYKLPHGAAHRISLVTRKPIEPKGTKNDDPVSALLGTRTNLRPIVDRLLDVCRRAGELELAPKKGYLSLRNKKQFAMIKPAAAHVDLGLILQGVAASGRLESAATFNALFTHRVRVRRVEDVDGELRQWIMKAKRDAA